MRWLAPQSPIIRRQVCRRSRHYGRCPARPLQVLEARHAIIYQAARYSAALNTAISRPIMKRHCFRWLLLHLPRFLLTGSPSDMTLLEAARHYEWARPALLPRMNFTPPRDASYFRAMPAIFARHRRARRMRFLMPNATPPRAQLIAAISRLYYPSLAGASRLRPPRRTLFSRASDEAVGYAATYASFFTREARKAGRWRSGKPDFHHRHRSMQAA